MSKITEERLNQIRKLASLTNKKKVWYLYPSDGTKSKNIKDFLADMNKNAVTLEHDTWESAKEEAQRISEHVGSIHNVGIFSVDTKTNAVRSVYQNGNFVSGSNVPPSEEKP